MATKANPRGELRYSRVEAGNWSWETGRVKGRKRVTRNREGGWKEEVRGVKEIILAW